MTGRIDILDGQAAVAFAVKIRERDWSGALDCLPVDGVAAATTEPLGEFARRTWEQSELQPALGSLLIHLNNHLPRHGRTPDPLLDARLSSYTAGVRKRWSVVWPALWKAFRDKREAGWLWAIDALGRESVVLWQALKDWTALTTVKARDMQGLDEAGGGDHTEKLLRDWEALERQLSTSCSLRPEDIAAWLNLRCRAATIREELVARGAAREVLRKQKEQLYLEVRRSDPALADRCVLGIDDAEATFQLRIALMRVGRRQARVKEEEAMEGVLTKAATVLAALRGTPLAE